MRLLKLCGKHRYSFFLMCVLVLPGCDRGREQDTTQAYNAVSLVEADALLSGPVENGFLATNGQADAAQKPQQEIEKLVSLDHPTDKTIQIALKKLDLYHGKIDGKLGKKSKKAIKEFQSRNKLVPDGKVGPKTWCLLREALEELPQ